ncbi:hypothetical protein [uncultured Tateyamaria sp.]|uniref:hypothetical protein n=1 Tax=uncultured Tateyamaria sp. TaxID=455651 RepID=UPI0026341BD2|nr:hypothetical protein [uncultured Tateyamaria sp.]
MSIHPTLPGLFEPVQAALPLDVQPATEKQIAFARSLAARTGRPLPAALLTDRAGLSAWIDGARPKTPEGPFAAYPSAKQVQFAERIARLKRREIPAECFKDKGLMSRWIDGNKPR